MRKGVTAAVIGAVLSLGEFAAAQAPLYTVQADRARVQGQVAPGGGVTTQSKVGTSHFLPEIAWDETLAQRLKLTGNVVLYNVVFQVNGVTLRADRAVINGGEATLDGNVRLTMPQSK